MPALVETGRVIRGEKFFNVLAFNAELRQQFPTMFGVWEHVTELDSMWSDTNAHGIFQVCTVQENCCHLRVHAQCSASTEVYMTNNHEEPLWMQITPGTVYTLACQKSSNGSRASRLPDGSVAPSVLIKLRVMVQNEWTEHVLEYFVSADHIACEEVIKI